MSRKHPVTKYEEQLPVQIYSIPCCFNSSTLRYTPKGNGVPHLWLTGKSEVMEKSSKRESDTESKKMFSQSELSEHEG